MRQWSGQARVRDGRSTGLAMTASSSRSSKMAGFWPPIAVSTATGARGVSTGVGSESSELRLAVVSLETALEGPVESEVALAASPSPSPAPAPAWGISRCGATG